MNAMIMSLLVTVLFVAVAVYVYILDTLQDDLSREAEERDLWEPIKQRMRRIRK